MCTNISTHYNLTVRTSKPLLLTVLKLIFITYITYTEQTISKQIIMEEVG